MDAIIIRVVEMLKSYKQEPNDFICDLGETLTEEQMTEQLHNTQIEMANIIFEEILEEVSEEEKAELTKQFNRSR